MDKRLKDDMLAMIIEELAKDSSLDDENRMKSYMKVFDIIYSENYRHEYSKITRVLFSLPNSEERDYLLEKLKMIDESMSNYETKKRLHKLSDHIELENIRMSELEKISRKAIQASKSIEDIKDNIEDEVRNIENKTFEIENETNKSSKKLEGIQKNLKNNTTESITILSIFAGVVMAFTGGFSYISQAIAALNQIGPYRAGIFIILIGMIMFDVIFLLLYMIGKLTERYIGSRGKCHNPEQGCKNKSITCSANRYPYVVWFNLISSIIILTIINLYCIDRYNILSRINNFIWTNFVWDKLFLYLVPLLFLITYVPFGILIYIIYNNKCNCEQ